MDLDLTSKEEKLAEEIRIAWIIYSKQGNEDKLSEAIKIAWIRGTYGSGPNV